VLERIWKAFGSLKSLIFKKQRKNEVAGLTSGENAPHGHSPGAVIRENEIAVLDELALAKREAEQIVQQTPYLGQSITPILTTLIQFGLKGRRLQNLLAIIGTSGIGAHSRNSCILKALLTTYTDEDLKIAGKDDSKYEMLLEHLKQSTEFKYECSLINVDISHETSLKLIRRYGNEAIVHIRHMADENIDPRDMGRLLKRIMNGTQDPDEVIRSYRQT